MAKTLPPLGDVPDAAYDRLVATLDGANAAQKLADFKARTFDFWRREIANAERRAFLEEQAAADAAWLAAQAERDDQL